MTNTKGPDRRQFLRLMGMTTVASALNANIAKSLAISDAASDVRALGSEAQTGAYDGTIKVVSGKLTNGGGTPIMLRGMNVEGLEASIPLGASEPWAYGGWYSNSGQSPYPYEPTFSLLAGYKANVVRIPLNELCWMQTNPAYTPAGVATNMDPNKGTANDYRTTVAAAVSTCQSLGMYVILDLHTNSPNGAATGQVGNVPLVSPYQQNMADADHSLAFWTSVAITFKSNPGVMFEVYNEPHLGDSLTSGETEWGVWLNGGTITNYSSLSGNVVANWTCVGMQALVNTIRATGATNVIICGGSGYAGNINQWAAHKPADTLTQSQIVCAFHAYPSVPYGPGVSLATAIAADQFTGDTLVSGGQLNCIASTILGNTPCLFTELGGVSAIGATGPVAIITTALDFIDAQPIGQVGVVGWGMSPFPISSTPGGQGTNNQLIYYSGDGTSGTIIPTDGYGTQYLEWMQNHDMISVVQVGDGAQSLDTATCSTGTSGKALGTALAVNDVVDVLVCFYTGNASNTCIVTDNLGNSYGSAVDHLYDATNHYEFYRFVAVVKVAGIPTITATCGTHIPYSFIAAAVMRGINPSAPYNRSNFVYNGPQATNGGGANTQTSGNTPTLTVQPAMVSGWGLSGAFQPPPTAGTGFTAGGNFWSDGGIFNASLAYEYKVATSLTAVAATFTPQTYINAYTFCGVFN
jgi:aryl-phospho-beta-D-glucosidase BglC (GH1 family)